MDIIKNAIEIRDYLKKTQDCAENPIDVKYGIIPPYRGGDDVKMIIIGQDPTIRNEKQRANIHVTLNLDKQGGSLYRYIERLCNGLGLSLDNVYATNVYKYFYSIPPADTKEVLTAHFDPNLELLIKELSNYPNAIIVTLGEPVLKLLTNEKSKVRDSWGYKKGLCTYHFEKSYADSNKIKKDFYPLPHQPSLRKKYYRDHLLDYLNYIKENGIK